LISKESFQITADFQLGSTPTDLRENLKETNASQLIEIEQKCTESEVNVSSPDKVKQNESDSELSVGSSEMDKREKSEIENGLIKSDKQNEVE
jgi:hypothetical protein